MVGSHTEMDGVKSCNLTTENLHDKGCHGIPDISDSDQKTA